MAYVTNAALSGGGPLVVPTGGPPGLRGERGADSTVPGPEGPEGRPGRDGTQGPAGAGAVTSREASANVPLWSAVVVSDANRCVPADPSNPAHRGQVIGVTAYGGMIGSQVEVQSVGDLLGPVADFAEGTPLFVGAGGILTPIAPTSGWRQNVATAVSSSQIVVALGEARVVADEGTALVVPSGFASAATTDDVTAGADANKFVTPQALTGLPRIKATPGAGTTPTLAQEMATSPIANGTGYRTTRHLNGHCLLSAIAPIPASDEPVLGMPVPFDGSGHSVNGNLFGTAELQFFSVGGYVPGPHMYGQQLLAFKTRRLEAGAQEIGLAIQMINDTGRPTAGNDPDSSNASINNGASALTISTTVRPGGANAWGAAIAQDIEPGVGSSGFYCTLELDTNNFNASSSVGSGPAVSGIFFNTYGTKKSFAMLWMTGFEPTADSPRSEKYFEFGIFAQSSNLINQDFIGVFTGTTNVLHSAANVTNSHAFLFDESAGPYSYHSTGLRTMATFRLDDNSPVGIDIAGIKAAADIRCNSSAPSSLLVQGNRFGPIIDLTQATAPFSIALRSGQPISFGNLDYQLSADAPNGRLVYRQSGSERVYFTPSSISPAQDNGFDLGTGGLRYRNLYVANNPIVGSDRSLKTNDSAFPSAFLDAIGDVDLLLFQYVAAVEEKGKGAARIHSGVIAQQLVAAFAARGIDAFRYGLVGRDPVIQQEARVRTVLRPKTKRVEDVRTRVEVLDGRAVAIEEPFDRDEPEYRDLPVFNPDGIPRIKRVPIERTELVFDKDGQPVMEVRNGECPRTGETVSAPRQKTRTLIEYRDEPEIHREPVMEEVEETYTVEVAARNDDGTPKEILVVRYEQILVALAAWTRREIARLNARLPASDI